MATEDNVQQLNDQLVSDADLRQRFLADPVSVLGEFGVLLNDAQKLALDAWKLLEKTEEDLLGICGHGPGIAILF